MNPLDNPFSPGAGSPPPELVGRNDLIERAEVTLHRLKLGRPAKSMILVGLRGVGKTVLLSRINRMAEDAGYRAEFLEAHEGKPLAQLLLPYFRQTLFHLDQHGDISEKVKRGFRVLRSFVTALKAKAKVGDFEFELGVDPERGTADSGDLETDLPQMLSALGEAAQERGTSIALCIDEMQYLNDQELSAVIMALHRCAQRSLPVALFGAGLPQIIGQAGKSKSYAERLFDYPTIGPLPEDAANEALQAPVQRQGIRFAPAALKEVFRVTQGYPYFLQQWAYECWNLASGPVIEESDALTATRQSIEELDRSFFRVRFDRLTPREKDYLRALAQLGPGPQRSSDVANVLTMKIQAAAPLRDTLQQKGMIYSPSYGDIEFTVPLFDAFMRRVMPQP